MHANYETNMSKTQQQYVCGTGNEGTTEGPTTQKPASTPETTVAPTDPCEAFASNASVCCDKAELKCMYIVCQEIVTNKPHMGR